MVLLRLKHNEQTCIGVLIIDGVIVCKTVERYDKMVKSGTYGMDYSTFSPRFGSEPFYKRVCDGKLPRLQCNGERNGILVHCGNSWCDTTGCILVGQHDEKCTWRIRDSRITFSKLYARMLPEKKLVIVNHFHDE